MKKYTKLLIALLSLGSISALEANVKIKVIFDSYVSYVQHREKPKGKDWSHWHRINPIAGTTDIYDIDTDKNDEYCVIKDIYESATGLYNPKQTNKHTGHAFIGKTTWDLTNPDDKEIY